MKANSLTYLPPTTFCSHFLLSVTIHCLIQSVINRYCHIAFQYARCSKFGQLAPTRGGSWVPCFLAQMSQACLALSVLPQAWNQTLSVKMILRSQGLDTSYMRYSWAVTASVSSLVRRITHTHALAHRHTHVVLLTFTWYMCGHIHNANWSWRDFSYISDFTFLLQWVTGFLTSFIDYHLLCPII